MLKEKPVQLAIKRAFDVLGATTLIILASPVLALTALAVKSQRIGPVIFKQQRYGENAKPFEMYKFRSLRDLKSGEPDALDTMATRLTPLTRMLRKSSLDELPQLFNVLAGDMSLVGPRPDFRLSEDRVIYGVKPGMTGPSQVSGRNSLSRPQKAALETEYAQNWSLLGDVKILGRTIPAWLTAKGYQEIDSPKYF